MREWTWWWRKLSVDVGVQSLGGHHAGLARA